jgi:cell division protein FtsB
MDIKIYQKKASEFAQRLNDLHFVGQLVFVVIVLLISWSGIKTIQTNYSLQKKISTLKQNNQVQKLKNTNLSLQNNYFNSNQYIDLSARQNFGLASPGEKEVIVPKDVALSFTVDLPNDTALPAASKQPSYQRHFQSWEDFFLNRQH